MYATLIAKQRLPEEEPQGQETSWWRLRPEMKKIFPSSDEGGHKKLQTQTYGLFRSGRGGGAKPGTAPLISATRKKDIIGRKKNEGAWAFTKRDAGEKSARSEHNHKTPAR